MKKTLESARKSFHGPKLGILDIEINNRVVDYNPLGKIVNSVHTDKINL